VAACWVPARRRLGIDPALLALACGSGGLFFSHVNDSGFWLFKQDFQLTMMETFRSWTLLVTFQALLGLAGVLLLHALGGLTDPDFRGNMR
jgi:H+/gluconate symporter-like permease